ncbi:MAG: glycoside hydrolase [Sedimentisphaerales bacterium]|jgi:uncharacterized OB-fold protein|nr:glycoside hydrolase [Sedimentisphaerales bacterium]
METILCSFALKPVRAMVPASRLRAKPCVAGVVELKDGRLMMFMRTDAGSQSRYIGTVQATKKLVC